jgi:hypothetical protein
VLVIDADVLVDAANRDSPWRSPCLSFVERRQPSASAWFSTWPIVYEFLRVTTHARVLQKPLAASKAWEFIVASLLAAPGFSLLIPTPRHAAVAAEVLSDTPQLAGNITHDAHTAILMREHGISRIVTRDADFHRFRFLEVLDPREG